MKISTSLIGIALISSSTIILADEAKPAQGLMSTQQQSWSYTVLKNDSFERIYQRYLTKRANILALSELNHHKLTKKLQPDQVLIIPFNMLKKLPVNAEVLLTSGDVTANNLQNSDRHAVSKGEMLTTGASLLTGKNSLAKVRFADGSMTNLQSNSSLSIQSSFQYAGIHTYVVQLKLAQGRADTIANPTHQLGNHMQIETPSAIAAVRGTEFRVKADGDITLQETLEGQVGFSSADQEILLAKGFGSAAEKDKAPLPPIILPKAPDLSAFAKQIEAMPVEFNLPPQQEVIAFVSQLALDANFTQILNEQVVKVEEVQQTKLSFDHLADGQYYLKVRAQEQHGLQGKDALHVFNVKHLPLSPQLIEPLDDEMITLAPTLLSWTAVPFANRYLLQIARDVNFENKIFERVTQLNQSILMHSFGAGTFYWRVAVLNAGKSQQFSAYRKFKR